MCAKFLSEVAKDLRQVRVASRSGKKLKEGNPVWLRGLSDTQVRAARLPVQFRCPPLHLLPTPPDRLYISRTYQTALGITRELRRPEDFTSGLRIFGRLLTCPWKTERSPTRRTLGGSPPRHQLGYLRPAPCLIGDRGRRRLRSRIALRWLCCLIDEDPLPRQICNENDRAQTNGFTTRRPGKR